MQANKRVRVLVSRMSTFLSDSSITTMHPALPFYTPPQYARKDILNKWLDTTRQWDILYGRFLHNHLAHNWIVLAGVGGVGGEKLEEKMKWWNDTYIKHDISGSTLDSARNITSDMPIITSLNWETFITYSPVNYPAYLKYFDEMIEERGYEAVVQDHLPRLTAGLSGSALHPIIHLGLGLEVGHDAIIAEGLACMCVAYAPLSHLLPHSLGGDSESDSENALCQLYTCTTDGVTEAIGIIDSSLAFVKTATSPSIDLPAVAKAAAHLPSIKAYAMGEFGGRMLAFDEPSLPLGSSLNKMLPLLFPPLSQAKRASVSMSASEGCVGTDTDIHTDIDVDLSPAIIEATALIAAAYLASDNEFFVIHGATSLYSLIVAMQFLTPHQRRLALVYWWKACMAVLVAENFPGVDKLGCILDKWREGGHVALVMREDGEVEVVDAVAEGSDEERRLLVTPVDNRVTDEQEEEKWWQSALERSSCSLDEHASKGVYVMWRWSLLPDMPVQSKTLFKQVAANQIRVPGTAPVITSNSHSTRGGSDGDRRDNNTSTAAGADSVEDNTGFAAVHLPHKNIWFSG